MNMWNGLQTHSSASSDDFLAASSELFKNTASSELFKNTSPASRKSPFRRYASPSLFFKEG